MDKGFVAHFERKVLFRIARFVAFSICFLLFLSIVGGAVYLLKGDNDKIAKPDPAAIAQSLKPAPTPTTSVEQSSTDEASSTLPVANQTALRGVKLPSNLQESFLDENNQGALTRWLEETPESDRQPFIDGLSAAVAEARKIGVSDADAMNRFHDEYASYLASRQAADAATRTQRLYVAGGLVSTLMLLALFSLVLVLLAIERNTRLSELEARA